MPPRPRGEPPAAASWLALAAALGLLVGALSPRRARAPRPASSALTLLAALASPAPPEVRETPAPPDPLAMPPSSPALATPTDPQALALFEAPAPCVPPRPSRAFFPTAGPFAPDPQWSLPRPEPGWSLRQTEAFVPQRQGNLPPADLQECSSLRGG